MRFSRHTPALAALLVLAFPQLAQSQSTPTPATDLASITAKASADRSLQAFLQQLIQLKSRSSDVRMMLDQQMFQNYPNGRPSGDVPINYRVMEQVQVARQRGQYLGQIMGSDLNNDGQITKQEVKDTLSIVPVQGAAEAFFSSDANDDNILSPVEIRAAVDHQLDVQQGRQVRANPVRLFDFNDDGILTPDERARGMAALGLTEN